MNRLVVLFCALLFAIVMAAAISPASAAQQTTDQPLATLVKGNNAFSLKLYRELSKQDGNLFFSSFSVSSALGMTYAGARGNTAKEMKHALSFELDQTLLHDTFKQLNQNLLDAANKDGQKLNIANGLCLTGGDLSEEFKALLQNSYKAELFSGNVAAINDWAKTKTEGKIEKIVEQLDPNSVCVLLNAIYFKGTWEKPFDEGLTREATFRISAKKEIKVAFMHNQDYFKLIENDDFQAISLPYKGNLMSMVVLLPRSVDGLASLEKKLSVENLGEWLTEIDSAHKQDTRLYLPKFKLETDYNLVPACAALGIKYAFNSDGAADFSGMGWPKGKLWISQIKHKAFVEVNEEGTEAAAFTSVGIIPTSERPPIPIFRADRPFIFLIRENSTGSILFMGRVSEPNVKYRRPKNSELLPRMSPTPALQNKP